MSKAPLFLQACVFARGKARALSASIPTETGTIWNAKEVEKAIFASHHMIESDY